MARPTLQDIAKEAGVSSSTVSLVLSQKGKISKEVREKVKAAAENLGYFRGPATYSSRVSSVAVLFHFDQKLAHTWTMLRQVTLKLRECLAKSNVLTILLPISYDMSDEEIFRQVIDSRAVAVFSMHFGREKLFSRLEEASIPVVVIINSLFQAKFHTVCADNFEGSYEATSHLLKLGHKRIVYADFDIYQLPATLSDRFLGFYKAINEHGVELPPERKLHLDVEDLGDIRSKLEAVFSGNDKPTAIFFVDDYLAARSIGALRGMGLSYPDDVSIIAAGGVLDYNEPYIPRITTMNTSPELLGKFSAEMMLNRLEGKPEESYVLKIKQQLIDRGSCRALE
ncbi:MAG TPA: LacI family DNA-binding transcriptional regulator [Spirochaetia bacterium]